MTLREAMIADIKDVFLDEDDGSESAVLWRGGYAPATILVNFSEPGTIVAVAGGEVETTAPEAEAASADLAGTTQGDVLEVCGRRYEIREILPGDIGMTRLVLSLDTGR